MSRRKKHIDYYGVDTETYIRGGEGLLSIQIHGKDTSEYIGVDTDIIDMSDEDIRWTRNIIHIFPVSGEVTLRGSIKRESVIYHSWIKL